MIIDFEKPLKRDATRSIVTNSDVLKQAEEILKKKDSNVSSFLHQQLIALVKRNQGKTEKS